ncbi:MAG: DNA polymerase III subunit delta' [Bauldia sp.]|nr:DNA polymerase III subunit delta' [Bauldia sp.]
MADTDERTRFDAIDGWPHPSEQTAWLGGLRPEQALRTAYLGGRMHHAWLIGGAKGTGKATLAYRFARFALAYPEGRAPEGEGLGIPGDHPAFRKIAAGSHPNLLTLERDWDEKNKRYKTEISVENVRRTVGFFGSTPGESGWRIAIVDPADDLNPNSANALLKMLEEPPPRALFLVLANVPGKLLPTIRSRCVKLDLDPIPEAEIASALKGAGEEGSEEEIRLAAALSQGSLRRAIMLLRGGGAGLYGQMTGILSRLPDLDVERLHAFADAVGAPRRDDAYTLFLDLFFAWLGRRVRQEPELTPAAEPGESLAAVPLARWAEVWEKTHASTSDAEEYNLDRKQVVLSTFMTLARATRM